MRLALNAAAGPRGASRSIQPHAITVLPFDADAATKFATIGASLADAGTPIGQLDTLIAAQAIVGGLIRVTNDTRHYGRIKGLKSENWRRQ